MRIIAYTYEAAPHCIDCTKKRFANQKGQYPPNTQCVGRPMTARDYKDGVSMLCDVNEHGIHEWQQDSEGSIVRPLYDEWQEFDESFWADNPQFNHSQYLACGDCHEIIDESTVMEK